MYKKYSQSGFAPILLILLAVVLLVGSAVLYIRNSQSSKTQQTNNNPHTSSSPTVSSSPVLIYSPVNKNISKISTIIPSIIPTAKISSTSTSNSTSNNTGNSTASTPAPTVFATSAPVATLTPTPTPTTAPTVNTTQGITISESCSGSTLNVSVYGEIPSPMDSNNGLWSTLTDNKTSQMMIYEYNGNQGSPTIHISANFPQTGGMHGTSFVAVIGDGRVYTVNIYAAPYTNGTPSLSNPVASNAFNMTCS